MITYATKVWQGDLQALQRHPKADLVIANNTHAKIVDIGTTPKPYLDPEMKAVKTCKTKYLLWYSADVIPPAEDWTPEAINLLETYPIVTVRWDNDPIEEHNVVDKADFGWTTFHFSDQCWIAKTKFMQSIDYDTDHPIKQDYPFHGGNSFERRVAQYLANKGTPVAVLDGYIYQHIKTEDK